MKRRNYETTTWRKLRLEVMDADGYICQICGKPTIDRHPKLQPVVDHIQPHRGDDAVFWNRTNLQTLHKSCHDKKTGHENLGRKLGSRTGWTGLDGWPVEEESDG